MNSVRHSKHHRGPWSWTSAAVVMLFVLLLGALPLPRSEVTPPAATQASTVDSFSIGSWTWHCSVSCLTKDCMIRPSTPTLVGSIPDIFAGLSCASRITRMLLYRNDLTGTIPQSFSVLALLQMAYLGGNRLTGSIPAELSTLTKLSALCVQEPTAAFCAVPRSRA